MPQIPVSSSQKRSSQQSRRSGKLRVIISGPPLIAGSLNEQLKCQQDIEVAPPLPDVTKYLKWNVRMQRVEGMESESQPSLFVLQLFGHTIELRRDLHRLTIDGHLLDFSRTECALMELLMHHAHNPGEFASITSLRKGLRGQPVDLHRLLSRRISEMRTKLWPFELDILNVGDLGYILTRKLVSVDEALSEAS